MDIFTHKMLMKLNRILKYLIIVGLIALAFLSTYYKYDDCSKCKFEYEDNQYNAGEFMSIYGAECFKVESKMKGIDVMELGNITVDN